MSEKITATNYFKANKKYIITVAIMVVIVICVYWIMDANYNNTLTNEEFSIYHTRFKKDNCLTCSNKTTGQCADCGNCGYCYTADGRGECVAGNVDGPTSRDDCSKFEYTSVDDNIYDYGSYDWDDTTKRYYKKQNGEPVHPYEGVPVTKRTSPYISTNSGNSK